jgi:hypothetical protein
MAFGEVMAWIPEMQALEAERVRLEEKARRFACRTAGAAHAATRLAQ